MSVTQLEPPSSKVFDEEPCAMPHEYAIRALMMEQDQERAKLRAIIHELEEIIRGAGLTPMTSNGESAQEGYRLRARALEAVMEYFGCKGFTLDGLPVELHETFAPLIVR